MLKDSKFNWQIKDVFQVFVISFLLELLLFLVLKFFGIEIVLHGLRNNPYIKNLLILFVYLIQIAGMLLPLWFIAIRKHKLKIADFGFNWIGTGKTVLWVFISYVFFLGLSLFIITMFFNFGIEAFGFQSQRSIFEIFGSDPFGLTIAVIIAIGIAPFVEEIFFRGFMLQTLVKKIGVTWGIILTTLIFAAIHFEFQSMMPLLILSLILSVLYVRTESIWPGIIFHMFNNSIALLVMYLIEMNVLLT